MSKHYTKVKNYYDEKLWPIEWVRNAVLKKWITADEYKEITGEDYTE